MNKLLSGRLAMLLLSCRFVLLLTAASRPRTSEYIFSTRQRATTASSEDGWGGEEAAGVAAAAAGERMTTSMVNEMTSLCFSFILMLELPTRTRVCPSSCGVSVERGGGGGGCC